MGLFKKKKKDDTNEPILVATISDTALCGMYQDLLKSNNIPFICRKNGSAGYMDILFGGYLVYENIFVHKENYEAAKELYDTYVIANSEYETLDDEEQ